MYNKSRERKHINAEIPCFDIFLQLYKFGLSLPEDIIIFEIT